MPRAGGPIPKPKPSRARDVARRAIDGTTLSKRPKVKAPRMPAGLHPDAREWWNSWKGSPQAELFGVTDWQRLKLVARLVDAFARDPRPSLLAEIRLNESRFGATPEDRLRLRWRFAGDPVAPAEDDVGDYGLQSKSGKRKPSRRRADPRLRLVE